MLCVSVSVNTETTPNPEQCFTVYLSKFFYFILFYLRLTVGEPARSRKIQDTDQLYRITEEDAS